MKVLIIRRIAAFEPYLGRVTAWWSGLSRREQILLAVLTVLTGIWLLSVLLVSPLQSARAQALADIRTYETLNARLRQAGSLVPSGTAQRSGDAASIIPASGSQFGLAFTSIVPEGSNIRVTAAQLPYDSLMRWLAELERSSSIRVIKLKLDRGPSPGLVIADMLFQQ